MLMLAPPPISSCTPEANATQPSSAPADAGPAPPAALQAVPGWAAALVTGSSQPQWSGEAVRLAWGLALAACYGAALGARYGVAAMAVQAAGVPLALAAVAALAGPAFYILLAHAGHPIDGLGLAAALCRAIATAGLVLAGLAPAAALLTISTEGPVAAALYGTLGLAVGGGLGLRRLGRELGAVLERAEPGHRLGARLVGVGFACFATALAARVWWLAVPSLGGGL